MATECTAYTIWRKRDGCNITIKYINEYFSDKGKLFSSSDNNIIKNIGLNY